MKKQGSPSSNSSRITPQKADYMFGDGISIISKQDSPEEKAPSALNKDYYSQC